MSIPLDNKKILLIDDVPTIRTFLRISVEAMGANCYEAATAQQGLDASNEHHPDLVILDLGLPDKDGLDILGQIKSGAHSPKVIILSVRKDRNVIERALCMGADEYLCKPFTMEALLESMARCLGESKVAGMGKLHLVRH